MGGWVDEWMGGWSKSQFKDCLQQQKTITIKDNLCYRAVVAELVKALFTFLAKLKVEGSNPGASILFLMKF